MKKIYRLLVILMGLTIFMGVYMLVKKDQFSNIQPPQNQPQQQKNAGE